MATVTWLDPLLVLRTVECLTLEEAYDYEAALDCSGIATNVRVSDPEWDQYMDDCAASDGDALEAMFLHDETCQQAHVRCAESVYWMQDHAAHVDSFYESGIPF